MHYTLVPPNCRREAHLASADLASRVDVQPNPVKSCDALVFGIHAQAGHGRSASRCLSKNHSLFIDTKMILPALPAWMKEIDKQAGVWIGRVRVIALADVARAAGKCQVRVVI